MKRIALFSTILFLLSAVLPAEAASFKSSVIFTNLDRRQFIVDLTAAPTNMVRVKLNTTQFDTGGDTITITNITGVTATNIFTDTIWTNDLTLTYLKPGKGASVVLGANAGPWWSPNASDGFTVVHDQAAGESDTTYIYAAAVDDSAATINNADFTVTLQSTAQANGALNLTATTNGIVSRFTVSLQPDADVARIELYNKGAPTFSVMDNSGFTGTGLNFLSDDGTYKASFGDLNVTNLYVTNLTVNNTSTFNGRVTINTNVFITNATIFINGTNVATINPTDNYVPYRTGTNSFGDSPWYRITTNQMGFFNTNVFLQLIPGTYFGSAAPSLALGLEAALVLTTNGVYNTAIGNNTMQRATSGSFNTAFGYNAGNSRTTGGQNVILGNDAMGNELVAGTSSYNVAVGNEALYGLIGGEQNTAVGFQAGKFLTSGNANTSLGSGAYGGDAGSMNVAIGRASMITASGGGSNTMVGAYSGHIIESGSWNVGLGFEATPSVNSITNTIAIGTAVKTTNNNEIVIGNSFNTKAIFPITSYTGAGTLFLSDDGTYKTGGGGGTTINPTDLYVPYRSNATTFADSPIWVAPSGDTMVDGAIDVGGSGTSQFSGPVEFLSTVSITNLTPNTIVKVDASTNLASVTTGTGALTNDGAGNFGWFDLSAVSGGTTINPTDNYLPVRTSATTFGDSPLSVINGTNILGIGGLAFTNKGFFSMGLQAGVSNTITSFTGLDPTSTYNFGSGAGKLMSLDGTIAIHNTGFYAGQSANLEDTDDVYNYGFYAGSAARHYQADHIYNYGDYAGSQMGLTQANNIYNIGYKAGEGMLASSSSAIYNIGHQANMSQTFIGKTNMIAFGTGSITTNSNDFVLGGVGVYNYFFSGASSTFSGPMSLNTATVSGNIGALLSVGDTTFVNMAKASQTNTVTGALTFAHATNGVAGVEYTHVRTFMNGNGADYLVTLPAAWINPDGASFTLTNNGIVKLYVNSMGPTADAASQTNVISQIKFCK